MRSPFLVWMLVLCTGCALAPAGKAGSVAAHLATVPTSTATQPPAAVPSPTSSLPPTGPSPSRLFDVVIDNIVIGPQNQLFVSGYGTSGGDLRLFAQWESRGWTALGTGFKTAGNALAVDAAGGLYTEIIADTDQGCATGIMKWDGNRWQAITGEFSRTVDAVQAGRVSCNIPVTALAVDGDGNLYVVGSLYYQTPDASTELPMGYLAVWNGKSWALVGNGFDKVNLFALAASDPAQVYLAGEQPATPGGGSGFIAGWDGARWTQLDAGRPDIIHEIGIDPSGGLFVAGQKTTPGAFVDYWDGAGWSSIASQFGGETPAVSDLVVDGTGQVCVGGSFDSVDGAPANNIACWDGQAWRGLGSGTNERVGALAFDLRGDLYAVGYFTEAGGVPTDHAAMWDGQNWRALSP
jgi:hypothetical protein